MGKDDDTLQLQWLGINGVRFFWRGSTILLDPYLTRSPGAMPDVDLLHALLPEADLIVVSHSHWDHLADTPEIARHTGARVLGSTTTMNVCRAWGVPEEQLQEVQPDEEIRWEDLTIRFLPSRHALRDDGRIPYPGELTEPPDSRSLAPADMPEGGTFAPCFDFDGFRVLDVGSANLEDQALQGCHVDVLLLSIARYENVDGFLKRVMDAVTPDVVIPVHYDNFSHPLSSGLTPQSYVDPGRFDQEMESVAPDTKVIWLDLLEQTTFEIT